MQLLEGKSFELIADELFWIEELLQVFDHDDVIDDAALPSRGFQSLHNLRMHPVPLGLIIYRSFLPLLHQRRRLCCFDWLDVGLALRILSLLYFLPFCFLEFKLLVAHHLQLLIIKFANFEPFWLI